MILRRKTIEATVPSMAMGDIAFLLLIFIVLLARARDESHLVWQPATGSELVIDGGFHLRPTSLFSDAEVRRMNTT
mgnify:CR=1 FL=1